MILSTKTITFFKTIVTVFKTTVTFLQTKKSFFTPDEKNQYSQMIKKIIFHTWSKNQILHLIFKKQSGGKNNLFLEKEEIFSIFSSSSRPIKTNLNLPMTNLDQHTSTQINPDDIRPTQINPNESKSLQTNPDQICFYQIVNSRFHWRKGSKIQPRPTQINSNQPRPI